MAVYSASMRGRPLSKRLHNMRLTCCQHYQHRVPESNVQKPPWSPLHARVLRTLKRKQLINSGSTVLLAVSGGQVRLTLPRLTSTSVKLLQAVAISSIHVLSILFSYAAMPTAGPLHSVHVVQDSLSMSRLMLDMRKHLDVQLAVGHCDHGWRQDSAANANHVKQLAHSWDLPYHQCTANQALPSEVACARLYSYVAYTSHGGSTTCDAFGSANYC